LTSATAVGQKGQARRLTGAAGEPHDPPPRVGTTRSERKKPFERRTEEIQYVSQLAANLEWLLLLYYYIIEVLKSTEKIHPSKG
jgi:hypothetical protein